MYIELVSVLLALTSHVTANYAIDETPTNLIQIECVPILNNDVKSIKGFPNNDSNYGDFLFGDMYIKSENTTLLSSDVFINDVNVSHYTYTLRSYNWWITQVGALNIGRNIGYVSYHHYQLDGNNSTVILNIKIPNDQVRILIESRGISRKGGSANLKASGLFSFLGLLLYLISTL